MEKLKYLVYSIAILSNVVFFSINSLLGVEYEGGGVSNGYLYFTVLLFFLVLIFSFADIRKATVRFGYFIPLFFSIFFIIETSLADSVAHIPLMRQSFKYFWAFSAPCILVGANLGNTKELEKIFPWIDFLALFVSLGCIVSLPRMLLSGNIQFGGGNYQQLSYNSGLMFSILLNNAINDNKYRFKFLRNKLYTVFTVLLMLGCLVCIFASGGRGGFLLLIVNVLFLCFSRRAHFVKIIIISLLSVLLVYFAASIFNIQVIEDIITRGYDRIVGTFFSNGGVSVSKTGREEVYSAAIKLISSNPLGYGFFRSYAIMSGSYPHNIFLEILLNGGVILLICFGVLIIGLIMKAAKLRKYIDLGPFFVLASYPIVMLLFTSTYLWSGAFWFCLTFLLSVNFKF